MFFSTLLNKSTFAFLTGDVTSPILISVDFKCVHLSFFSVTLEICVWCVRLNNSELDGFPELYSTEK